MKKRILYVILTIAMILSITGGSLAGYDGTGASEQEIGSYDLVNHESDNHELAVGESEAGNAALTNEALQDNIECEVYETDECEDNLNEPPFELSELRAEIERLIAKRKAMVTNEFNPAKEKFDGLYFAFVLLEKEFHDARAAFDAAYVNVNFAGLRAIFENYVTDYENESAGVAFQAVAAAREAALAALGSIDEASSLLYLHRILEEALHEANEAYDKTVEALDDANEILYRIAALNVKIAELIVEHNNMAETQNKHDWIQYGEDLLAYARAWAEFTRDKSRALAEYNSAKVRYRNAMSIFECEMRDYERDIAVWKELDEAYRNWNDFNNENNQIQNQFGATANIRIEAYRQSRPGEVVVDNHSGPGVPPENFRPFLTPNAPPYHAYHNDVRVATIENIQGGNNPAKFTVHRAGIFTVYIHANRDQPENGNFERITFRAEAGGVFFFGNYSNAVWSTGNWDAINQIGRGVNFMADPGEKPPHPGERPTTPIRPEPPELRPVEKPTATLPTKPGLDLAADTPFTSVLIELSFDTEMPEVFLELSALPTERPAGGGGPGNPAGPGTPAINNPVGGDGEEETIITDNMPPLTDFEGAEDEHILEDLDVPLSHFEPAEEEYFDLEDTPVPLSYMPQTNVNDSTRAIVISLLASLLAAVTAAFEIRRVKREV